MITCNYQVKDITNLVQKELLLEMSTAQTCVPKDGSATTLDFILPFDTPKVIKDFWNRIALEQGGSALPREYKFDVVTDDLTFVGCLIHKLGETIIDGELKYLVSLYFDCVNKEGFTVGLNPSMIKESKELREVSGTVKFGFGLVLGGLLGFIFG